MSRQRSSARLVRFSPEATRYADRACDLPAGGQGLTQVFQAARAPQRERDAPSGIEYHVSGVGDLTGCRVSISIETTASEAAQTPEGFLG